MGILRVLKEQVNLTGNVLCGGNERPRNAIMDCRSAFELRYL
jgi:hypothetical protein